MNGKQAAALVIFLSTTAVPAPAQDWSLQWWTVDTGGEMFSTGGDWTLSGTLGQWDASAATPLSGGGWQLSGGFWVASTPEGDLIFMDGFES